MASPTRQERCPSVPSSPKVPSRGSDSLWNQVFSGATPPAGDCSTPLRPRSLRRIQQVHSALPTIDVSAPSPTPSLEVQPPSSVAPERTSPTRRNLRAATLRVTTRTIENAMVKVASWRGSPKPGGEGAWELSSPRATPSQGARRSFVDSYCSETSTTADCWNISASSQAPESPKMMPASPKISPQIGAAGLLRSTATWHVLDATKDLDPAGKSTPVPGTAKAIVILGDHDRVQPVRDALRHIAEARGPALPVVVVLTFYPLDDADVLAVVATQRDLCARGADDVALAAGDPISLRAVVSMSIARAEMRLEAVHKEAAADVGGATPGVARVRSDQGPHRRSSFILDPEQRCKPKVVIKWVAGRLFENLPKVPGTLPEKPERIGSWVLDRQIGEGGFGKVWMSTNSATGEQEALKLVPKELLNSVERACSAWTEIQLLGRLEHRHIVQFKGVLHCDSHLCIRMGVAGRNMLRAMVTSGGRFRVDVAKRFLLQLSSALAYCHREGVAHRDVKPENVGVSDDGKRIRLLDFGCATDLHGMCEDVAGTMPFMAPEVIDLDDEEVYSPAGMDVWASGVLLLEMLCGCGKLNRMLGWGKTVRPTKVRKQELDVFFGMPGCLEQALEDDIGPVEPSLVELLSGMLEVNMLRRLSATAVQASPWLKGRTAS